LQVLQDGRRATWYLNWTNELTSAQQLAVATGNGAKKAAMCFLFTPQKERKKEKESSDQWVMDKDDPGPAAQLSQVMVVEYN
jgi:hypothetical protein